MDVSDAIKIMETEEKEENQDEIIRDGRNIYLRIPLDQGYETGYAFRMISSVQPSCLLPIGIVREGHQVYADYQISGWTALSSVPGEDLLNLLYGFVNALDHAADELADCLLSADELALEPGRIFLRRETGEIRFCYLLEGTKPFGEALQELMEFFIKAAKPEGEQEVLLLYGLYQKSREENVTPKVLASFRTELLQGQMKRPAGGKADAGERPELAPWEGEESVFQRKMQPEFPEDDTQEICERLGMDPKDRQSGFSRWKKEREAKKTKRTEEPKWSEIEQNTIPVREVCDREVPGGKEETKTVSGSESRGKTGAFLKKHLPEILIGAAAVILALCAFLL